MIVRGFVLCLVFPFFLFFWVFGVVLSVAVCSTFPPPPPPPFSVGLISHSTLSVGRGEGDHIGVFPHNGPDVVEELAARLRIEEAGYSLDTAVALVANEGTQMKPPFPPCTLRTALSRYLNITDPPSKKLFKALAQYAEDPAERESLALLGDIHSAAGKARYEAWVKGDERNLASVLEAFPSWRPPLDHVLEVLPRLQPRYYSISSSPKVHPRRAHITAITVEYTTPTGAVRRGVCTSYFSRLSAGDRVECFIRTSSFRPPPPDVPYVGLAAPTCTALASNPLSVFIPMSCHT